LSCLGYPKVAVRDHDFVPAESQPWKMLSRRTRGFPNDQVARDECRSRAGTMRPHAKDFVQCFFGNTFRG